MKITLLAVDSDGNPLDVEYATEVLTQMTAGGASLTLEGNGWHLRVQPTKIETPERIDLALHTDLTTGRRTPKDTP